MQGVRDVVMANSIPGLFPAPTKHRRLVEWVAQIAALTKPESVVWCDGSEEEWERLTAQLVDNGTFVRLNDAKKPNLEQLVGYAIRPVMERYGVPGTAVGI